jgi:hypothetical protein
MSFEKPMREPALATVHLVAVTLIGHGGTPPPSDLTIENYAGLTSESAAEIGCPAAVGFSMGANAALEMVGSGQFAGPIVRYGHRVRTAPINLHDNDYPTRYNVAA